jgi:glycerophosphoryl diester phosphodiesterase
MSTAAAARPPRKERRNETSEPRVIAHRGASRDRPENTLAAFDEALAQGADGIELDVQVSADGVPVVWHDGTLARAGGGRARVEREGLAALRRLDPAHRLDSRFRGLHIPTLEEVLSRYGRRTRLLVELKLPSGSDVARASRTVIALIRRMRLEDDVLLLSFDPEVLDACAAQAPRVGRVLNLAPPQRLGPRLASRLPGLYALSTDVRKLTPGFASGLHARGGRLLVYTCNTARAVERALDCHAQGIMSDRPAWLGATIAALRAGDAA